MAKETKTQESGVDRMMIENPVAEEVVQSIEEEMGYCTDCGVRVARAMLSKHARCANCVMTRMKAAGKKGGSAPKTGTKKGD